MEQSISLSPRTYIHEQDLRTVKGSQFVNEAQILASQLPGVLEFSKPDAVAWGESNLAKWMQMRATPNGGDVLNLSVFEISELTRIANLAIAHTGINATHALNANEISIQGGTGVGKTTVVNQLGLPCIREHVEDNPGLSLSYSSDPAAARQAAFIAQMHFMLGRFSDLYSIFANSSPRTVVMDRSFEGDQAYIDMHQAAGNLTQEEVAILTDVRSVFSGIRPAHQRRFNLVLYASPTDIKQRIKERGRDYEQETIDQHVASQSNTLLTLGVDEQELLARLKAGSKEVLFDDRQTGGNRTVVIDTSFLGVGEVLSSAKGVISFLESQAGSL